MRCNVTIPSTAVPKLQRMIVMTIATMMIVSLAHAQETCVAALHGVAHVTLVHNKKRIDADVVLEVFPNVIRTRIVDEFGGEWTQMEWRDRSIVVHGKTHKGSTKNRLGLPVPISTLSRVLRQCPDQALERKKNKVTISCDGLSCHVQNKKRALTVQWYVRPKEVESRE